MMAWPQLSSMLSAWQWAALALVPPAIIALYFLKLKREPLEVPSTYLWLKSIEDLHVNSIWQRLRQSLLLLLQLLLLALLAAVLFRPSWQGSSLSQNRLIFLVDNSASMGATDVQPTRLDEAKRRVLGLIDEMRSGDVAMIVSFSDGARVEQMFTDSRGELRRRLDAIQPTDKPTSIAEALRVASVLANPGRSATDIRDTQVAEALPAQLFFFSDGNFSDDTEFSLGNLEPTPPVWIGTTDADNVAIVAFSTARSEIDPEKFQAFGRLENTGLRDATIDVELRVGDELVDAQRVEIPARKSRGVAFDLEHASTGVLELRLAKDDALAVDNRAWTVMHAPRRSRVLFVTAGDEPFQVALRTERALEVAEVVQKSPDFLTTPQYKKEAAGGSWDLVIYDRCRPEAMPQANTIFVGQLPPGEVWKEREKVVAPQIIDVNRAHPLMQWLDMADVLVLEAKPLVPPSGSALLIESTEGPLLALAPREGFEDVVTSFELVSADKIGTNWPVRPSFPVFVLNALGYLGGNRELQHSDAVQPGRPVALRPETAANQLTIVPPAPDAPVDVARGRHNVFHFAGTGRVGVYQVREGKKDVDRFAVNLFNPAESDIKVNPDRKLKIGHVEIESGTAWEPARRDAWKFILLAALAILLFEWYIYNRRAYL
ncbi:MAG: VWA domain-containing protein [Planctomycetia bacterium]|nr:VWA domain-containing protein [Planctomycetia bacterium]